MNEQANNVNKSHKCYAEERNPGTERVHTFTTFSVVIEIKTAVAPKIDRQKA